MRWVIGPPVVPNVNRDLLLECDDMTLVLTELGPFGIAMAADSAVTFTYPDTGLSYAEPNRARKLRAVPVLNAGMSCWGWGTIADMPTDQWVSDFIDSHRSIATLRGFAEELAGQLNEQVAPNTTGNNRLGFHLAGFEGFEGKRTPSFFHVHDGPSTVLESRGIRVDPKRFNANHDMPPEILQDEIKLSPRRTYITRNGDYQPYAKLSQSLENLFRELLRLGIRIPNSQNLDDRAEYLVFEIRTISELYRLSNLIPGIGGRIDFLTINEGGLCSQGKRFL